MFTGCLLCASHTVLSACTHHRGSVIHLTEDTAWLWGLVPCPSSPGYRVAVSAFGSGLVASESTLLHYTSCLLYMSAWRFSSAAFFFWSFPVSLNILLIQFCECPTLFLLNVLIFSIINKATWAFLQLNPGAHRQLWPQSCFLQLPLLTQSHQWAWGSGWGGTPVRCEHQLLAPSAHLEGDILLYGTDKRDGLS